MGSNVFDVCIGLAFPWLLFEMVYDGTHHPNSSHNNPNTLFETTDYHNLSPHPSYLNPLFFIHLRNTHLTSTLSIHLSLIFSTGEAVVVKAEGFLISIIILVSSLSPNFLFVYYMMHLSYKNTILLMIYTNIPHILFCQYILSTHLLIKTHFPSIPSHTQFLTVFALVGVTYAKNWVLKKWDGIFFIFLYGGFVAQQLARSEWGGC